MPGTAWETPEGTGAPGRIDASQVDRLSVSLERGYTMDDTAGGRPRHQGFGAVFGRLGLTISRSAGGVFPAPMMVGVQASRLLLLMVGCATPDWRGGGQQARDR